MSLTTTLTFPNGVKVEQPLGLFINNEFVKGKSGSLIEVINPSNGKPICKVHEALEEDVDIAVEAAEKAFKSWQNVTPAERGHILMKVADLMEKNAKTLASIESLDNGKSLAQALGDVGNSAGCIRYYAGWADKIHGKVITTDSDSFNYTRQEPIGVCGQIIPWNFPLLMASWKLGPALATGNVVVLKTSELTPLSALYLCQLFKEAGLPAGVLNVISGYGKTAGAAIASHMKIHKVAFTGSTLVGRNILKAAASSNLKKVTLELGGKSPSIVFDDADIEQAVDWVQFGVFFNMGQCCCAGTRIFVQEGIYDKFLKALKERTAKNKIGDPFSEGTFHGPQISQTQFDRIMGYVQHGLDEGAKLEMGGKKFGTEGYFIEPTIFSGVTDKMKIQQEEIFGPVCSISKFSTQEDVIEKANSTTYGLASAIFTRNLNTMLDVSAALHAGTVWVNNFNMIHYALPFGGFKESGIGRELGKYALANYTQIKTVNINIRKTL